MKSLVDSLRYLASLCEKEASDLSSGAADTVATHDIRRALDEVEVLTLDLEERAS